MNYTASYFEELGGDARSSARIVVPMVLEQVPARSVVDVGCATGEWLAVFQKHGIDRILGIDGEYVEPTALRIPPDRFRAVDLSQPFECGEEFDLAVSLEVGEHLPRGSAPGFVERLCRLAPIVLFSAAVPGQGGQRHVNEQWPEYWRLLFAANGFRMFDPFRPVLWHRQEVAYYYRQNLFLFVSDGAAQSHPHLSKLPEIADANALLLVAPRMVIDNMGVIGVLKRLPDLVASSLRRRWERLRPSRRAPGNE